MELDTILTAIGSVGFPIIMSILMLTYMQKSEDRHREDSENWCSAVVDLTTVVTDLKNNLQNNEDLQKVISDLTNVVNELISTMKGGG